VVAVEGAAAQESDAVVEEVAAVAAAPDAEGTAGDCGSAAAGYVVAERAGGEPGPAIREPLG